MISKRFATFFAVITLIALLGIACLATRLIETNHTVESLKGENQKLSSQLSSSEQEVFEKNQHIQGLLKEKTDLVNLVNKFKDQLQKSKQVKKEDPLDWMNFKATAYTAFCDTGCSGVTATGVNVSNASKQYNIIAVDPNVIPLYSLVKIKGLGTYQAMDTGGAIDGRHIDVLVSNKTTAKQFGVKHVQIKVIRWGKGHLIE